MNLALRKGTKAGVIDPAQHDALVSLVPAPELVSARLDPEAMHYYQSWTQFGSPMAAGMMGVMDLRAMQVPGREAWLAREVEPYGDDCDRYRGVWAALDDWAYGVLSAAARPEGGDGD